VKTLTLIITLFVVFVLGYMLGGGEYSTAGTADSPAGERGWGRGYKLALTSAGKCPCWGLRTALRDDNRGWARLDFLRDSGSGRCLCDWTFR